ncbi:gamma-glutamyl hydrolase-like [Onthophagus taurus]|uniref:gamma-glutamyl hydrolase-like n=1 Tax=Onthophagus taurus TaxID=166361 RepID=UPI000C20BBF6|nr:gamma-glutamyl hydrolase-like [Onthophagus taurus]
MRCLNMTNLQLEVLLLLTFSCCGLLAGDTPIIGVLSQGIYYNQKLDPKYHSYIAASYVKYLESAGARVVPVFIEKPLSYYEKVIKYTNGILLPGGAVTFSSTDGYTSAGQIIYDLAIELNNKGDYYPIWGTCLGMELLPYVASKGKDFLSKCSAKKIAQPLHFTANFKSSKIFSRAPDEIVTILKLKNVTYNNHERCYTEESFKLNKMDDFIVLSTNEDSNGFKFISSFESKKYPFYGVQFHPEKNNFEFKIGNNVPHSSEAIKMSQYFANFFVEESKRNNHSYPDWESEMGALIYNFSPQFTGLNHSDFLQMYLFERDEYGSNEIF